MISVIYLSQDVPDISSALGDFVKLVIQKWVILCIILHYLGYSESTPLLFPNDKLRAINSYKHKIKTQYIEFYNYNSIH